MNDQERSHYISLIEDAQKLFKLSLAVNGTCASTKQDAFTYLDTFSYFKHTVNRDDLYLDPDDEKLAAAAFEHCAIYVLAVQMDTILGEVFTDRFRHPDSDICSAAWISRLIRNAFAHSPLDPIWQTYSECDNKIYKVKDIITLETAGLNEVRVVRQHYGGPIAILKLSEFVKTEVSSIAAT